ncbi:hypothetical protein F5Y12DRAFT_760863 [Xylaria sp. FL1777]|nr:hypothetical protein F5Y12DRAFT_760863 [Xylaria sp. FL1777]
MRYSLASFVSHFPFSKCWGLLIHYLAVLLRIASGAMKYTESFLCIFVSSSYEGKPWVEGLSVKIPTFSRAHRSDFGSSQTE